MPVSRSLVFRSMLVAGALALFGPVAAAEASTSTNWSGYVAHGLKFKSVSALWTQPTLTCTPGTPTYSAPWVGLGGYSLNSKALEQIGTEADCSTAGKEISTAWLELVPAPSRSLSMIVRPGDVMAGHVTVVGNRVTLMLTDRTRHKTYTRKVTDANVDVTSADWIVEAPSECSGNGFQCQPLALANYGSEAFASANAVSTTGRSGAIASSLWRTEVITLSPGSAGRQNASDGGTTLGESTPSALTNAGTGFSLTYSPISPLTPPPAATAYLSSRAAGL
ncbi:MAG TPA: G1 family glutamic endopeptidase [Solirubrobacteraceae bacterium]|nr:G1 family glutamic endopeptidase [Solirubrobacteraceae bacterium]